MYHTHKEMGIRDIWFFFSLATVEIAKQWSNTFNILWENDYKIKILYSAISQVCVVAEGRYCWICQNLKILPPLELLSGKGWRWRESESCSVVSDSLWPLGPYSPWNSPDQNSGMGSLSFLQGILPTQGSNPSLLHCSWILHQLSHKGNPSILEQVAYPFSTRSSRPRNQTRVSGMAGRFFTNWAELSGNHQGRGGMLAKYWAYHGKEIGLPLGGAPGWEPLCCHLSLGSQLCPTRVTPFTVQAPLPMGFSRQEYWSGLPFLSPGDLPDLGIEPVSLALQANSLPTELWRKTLCWHTGLGRMSPGGQRNGQKI